ncbi:dioxygenase-like protein [Metarhizium robertsii]|uniref:Dioxygenase-like protein n=1 Tax=Metarhizium robertsii TaxID=568076 RepID=A0A0A1US89_9HYPO|nr:dioxygenase-like protein [Metarhizium robertsii]
MRYNDVSNQSSRFDPDVAKLVTETTGPNATTRHRQIMTSLIRHMTGVDLIDSLGQHFTAKSHEAFRLRDMLGLGSYVCEFDGESRRLSNKSAAWWMKLRIRLSLAAVPTPRPRRSSVLSGLRTRHFEKMAPPSFMIQYQLRVGKMHGKALDLATDTPISVAIVAGCMSVVLRPNLTTYGRRCRRLVPCSSQKSPALTMHRWRANSSLR